jgi:hypothetical protein
MMAWNKRKKYLKSMTYKIFILAQILEGYLPTGEKVVHV